jgi:hypothetical protein
MCGRFWRVLRWRFSIFRHLTFCCFRLAQPEADHCTQYWLQLHEQEECGEDGLHARTLV